ncbi:MAG: hypothetical protein ACE5EF_00775 [Dehalococcoidia bacterium]
MFVVLLIACWRWSDWAWAWWAAVAGLLAVTGLVPQVIWYASESRDWRRANQQA